MQTNSAVMKFKKPVKNYDMKQIMPDADDGQYTCEISKITAGMTTKTEEPKLTFEFKIESCDDGQDSKNKGRKLRTVLALMDGSAGNRAKQSLQAIVKGADLDPDTFPQTIESTSDFDGFIEQARGKKLPVWVLGVDNAGFTRLGFEAPKSSLGSLPSGDDEEDDDKPKGRNGNGKNGARRR